MFPGKGEQKGDIWVPLGHSVGEQIRYRSLYWQHVCDHLPAYLAPKAAPSSSSLPAKMDPSTLKGLRSAVTALKSDASLLHTPDLSFFRDYLVSLGAKLPAACASTGGGGVTEISSVAEWDAACAKGGKAVIDFTASWCPPW